MKAKYIRYWFEFDLDPGLDNPPGIEIGCGVTATDYEDAISLMKNRIFRKGDLPPIKKVSEDINIRTLDQHHVIPNMLSPHSRGIWFPSGYEHDPA